MEPQRKTTGLLMEYFPEELALLTEEYILPDSDRIPEELCKKHSIDIHLLSGSYGHWECAMSTTDVNALSYSLVGSIVDNNRLMILNLIARGADLNVALKFAASSLNLRYLACVVDTLINLGATEIIHVLNKGVFVNDMRMISFAVRHGAIPNSTTMILAGTHASWGIILLIHNLGIKYKPAMMSSVRNGRVDILKKFISLDIIGARAATILFSMLCKSENKKINHYICMATLLDFDIERCVWCDRSIAEHKQEISAHLDAAQSRPLGSDGLHE